MLLGPKWHFLRTTWSLSTAVPLSAFFVFVCAAVVVVRRKRQSCCEYPPIQPAPLEAQLFPGFNLAPSSQRQCHSWDRRCRRSGRGGLVVNGDLYRAIDTVPRSFLLPVSRFFNRNSYHANSSEHTATWALHSTRDVWRRRRYHHREEKRFQRLHRPRQTVHRITKVLDASGGVHLFRHQLDVESACDILVRQDETQVSAQVRLRQVHLLGSLLTVPQTHHASDISRYPTFNMALRLYNCQSCEGCHTDQRPALRSERVFLAGCLWNGRYVVGIFRSNVAYSWNLDFSALAIAVHTALQIFRPVVFGVNGEEAGLYRYRVPIYISTAVLPLTICALAFTRNGPAFIAQGPLCSLPLRPFWYRLALSWIPRYLAMLTILILYIALYIHVGRQFGTFKISETFGFRPNGHNRKATLFSERNVFEMAPVQSSDIKIVHNRSGSIAHSLGAMCNALKVSARSSIRRASEGTTCVNGSTSTNSGNSGVTKRTESLDIPRPILLTPVSPRDACSFNKPEGHIAISPISRQDHAPNAILTGHVLGPSPTTRLADWNTEHGLQDLSEPILTREMRAKRNQAMRQLRLLFIYPICYFICWLVPFILNLTNYSNYLVQHPPFVIALLAYISIALMGTVSALVFSVRERPWRHTIGSDGTFFGSFVVWKHDATRRCSDNSFVGYGSTSASCSVPGSSAGHTLFSSQNVPTLSSPSRPAPSRGVSLFSLRSPNYQANALQRNEDRLATDRPPLITQVSANTTPRVHEKYWFDVPSGRSSDDEEAGRSF